MISKGETLITVYVVESYKEYNKIEDDPHPNELSLKEQFKKYKEEEAAKNESCNCLIF